jgi:hypothetical protein
MKYMGKSMVSSGFSLQPNPLLEPMGCCEATSLTALTMKCWWYHPRPPFEKGHRGRLYLGGIPLGKWAIPPAIYIYIYVWNIPTYVWDYMDYMDYKQLAKWDAHPSSKN